MYTNSLIAVAGALVSIVAAIPMAEPHHHHHHKRDYIWVPHTEVVIETVAVTKTVWVEPGEYTPEVKPQGYGKSSSKSESKPAQNTPAAYTPPAPVAYSSSSTSVYVAPVPTTPTSTYVAPTPYVAPTTYEAPTTSVEPAPYVAPTTSSAPAPAATSASTGSSGNSLTGMAAAGKTYTGDLTWYDVGLGACGKTNVASDPIVAIPEAIFDAYSTGNPNTNPLCGKSVTITGKDGNKYTASIVDRCPGCTENDLDLSQDFFNKVTQNGDGRVGGMEWCFD